MYGAVSEVEFCSILGCIVLSGAGVAIRLPNVCRQVETWHARGKNITQRTNEM